MLQIPGVDHRKSLLARLPEHGIVNSVEDKLRREELDLDDAQYSYLLTLFNLPERVMPGIGTDDVGSSTYDDVQQAELQPSTTLKKAPEYNRAYKLNRYRQ